MSELTDEQRARAETSGWVISECSCKLRDMGYSPEEIVEALIVCGFYHAHAWEIYEWAEKIGKRNLEHYAIRSVQPDYGWMKKIKEAQSDEHN